MAFLRRLGNLNVFTIIVLVLGAANAEAGRKRPTKIKSCPEDLSVLMGRFSEQLGDLDTIEAFFRHHGLRTEALPKNGELLPQIESVGFETDPMSTVMLSLSNKGPSTLWTNFVNQVQKIGGIRVIVSRGIEGSDFILAERNPGKYLFVVVPERALALDDAKIAAEMDAVVSELIEKSDSSILHAPLIVKGESEIALQEMEAQLAGAKWGWFGNLNVPPYSLRSIDEAIVHTSFLLQKAIPAQKTELLKDPLVVARDIIDTLNGHAYNLAKLADPNHSESTRILEKYKFISDQVGILLASKDTLKTVTHAEQKTVGISDSETRALLGLESNFEDSGGSLIERNRIVAEFRTLKAQRNDSEAYVLRFVIDDPAAMQEFLKILKGNDKNEILAFYKRYVNPRVAAIGNYSRSLESQMLDLSTRLEGLARAYGQWAMASPHDQAFLMDAIEGLTAEALDMSFDMRFAAFP